MRSLFIARGVKRSVARGLCKKCRKTLLRSPSALRSSPNLLLSSVSSIFFVSRNSRFCALPSKKPPSSFRVSCAPSFAGLLGDCSFLKRALRSWVRTGSSILSSRMLASELLCFLPALPVSPAFVLRRKRSPSDLDDLTDLLSFDSTLRLSPKTAFSVFSGCTRGLPFLPFSSSTPPPMSLKMSKARWTSTGSVSKCRAICLRSEAWLGLLISMEGNLGVERADCGSSCLSPKENCRPYRLPRIPLQIQLFHASCLMSGRLAPPSPNAYNNSMPSSQKRDAAKPRIGSTAGFFNARSSPRSGSHAFSGNPYATVQLDGRIRQLGNVFGRIGRVERMIREQKMELQVQLPEKEWPADTHSLRPQFKVRTSKQHSRKGREEATSPHHLHLQNLSLECSPAAPTTANEERGRSFQETLKNRRRMHLRPVRRSKEASLLEMLNRISAGSPLQRYKSWAIGGKAGSFLQ